MRVAFTKMHGAGNDYVYVNAFETHLDDPPAVAQLLSPRRTGIGSDGLILIAPSDVADCRMEMYNADGSRGSMCGNGIRCVGKYVFDQGIAAKRELTVETDSGIKTLSLEVDAGKVRRVTVDMGAPLLSPDAVPVLSEAPLVDAPLEVDGKTYRITCVSMGNPHCVLFVDSTDDAPVTTLGPVLESHRLFPRRANIEFVRVIGEAPSARLRMRVWERGSGETAACGTGACASAVAASLTGRGKRQVDVELLGGTLQVEWREENDHVYMTGDAVEVFSGEVEI